MMIPKVYIESTVISYLAARPSKNVVIAGHQLVSADWWENDRHRFLCHISLLVKQEISRGDVLAAKRRLSLVENLPLLMVTDNAGDIARQLIEGKAIPEKSAEDALHIGIAASQGMDYLLSWNFKHICNLEKKKKIEEIVTAAGYICPSIGSPEDLGGDQND